MCGQVGIVMKGKAGLFKAEEDAFYQLLFADTIRGEDSTGIIAIERDGTLSIAKEATQAAWFIPQFRESVVGKRMFNSGKALIGHNRKQTVGKVADDTAHPFVVDETFALVHNGTLYSHEKLAKNCKVDSEALAIHLKKALDHVDYIAALNEAIPDIWGAYAVSFYNQDTHKVHLLRNKERPLAYLETDKAWFIASEGALLWWILGRNGLINDKSKIEYVPEDVLVSFDLETNTCVQEKLAPKKATAPTTKVTVTGGKTSNKKPTYTAVSTETEELSKNQFKRFRKKMLGSRIQFWADDYVEVNFPLSEIDGETLFTLMGECDDCKYDHIIITTPTDKVATNFAKGMDMIDCRWMGRVDNILFDQRSGKLSIYVSECKPLPFSFKPKQYDDTPIVIDAEYIRKKLDEQDKRATALALV